MLEKIPDWEDLQSIDQQLFKSLKFYVDSDLDDPENEIMKEPFVDTIDRFGKKNEIELSEGFALAYELLSRKFYASELV